MRGIILCLAFMVFSVVTAAQSKDRLLAELVQEVTIEAGKIEEPCFAMALADRLEYQFSGSGALDFNIHYHDDSAVYFPVEKKNLSQLESVFIATGSRQYCMMWTNRADTPVALNYHYQLYRSGVQQ